MQRGGSRAKTHRRPGEIRHRVRRAPLVVHVPRREPLLPGGEFLSGETGQYQRPLVLDATSPSLIEQEGQAPFALVVDPVIFVSAWVKLLYAVGFRRA